jgi:hypothetical protein
MEADVPEGQRPAEQGQGPRPLFDGVRRVVTRMAEKPSVTTEGRRVSLQCLGFQATFDPSTVRIEERRLVVVVGNGR